MYRDLTAWIECGEIDNTQVNMVFGYVCLKGLSRPIRLHLTGKASMALRGKRHRFCVAKIRRRRLRQKVAPPLLDVQQIGPVYDVEYDTDGFRITWAGQNGVMKVAIPALLVNVWEEEYEPDCFPVEEPARCGGVLEPNETTNDQPEDSVDKSNRSIRSYLSPDCDVYIRTLVETEGSKCPAEIDQSEVGESVQRLLAELAKYGISVTVCDHYSARDVYEFIWYVVLEEKTNPKLMDYGFIEHWMTHDFCDICSA